MLPLHARRNLRRLAFQAVNGLAVMLQRHWHRQAAFPQMLQHGHQLGCAPLIHFFKNSQDKLLAIFADHEIVGILNPSLNWNQVSGLQAVRRCEVLNFL